MGELSASLFEPNLVSKVEALLVSLANPVGDSIQFPLVNHRIREFIHSGETIHFILPAFPAKSANRNKTIGVLPDMADFLGLNRLNKLCQDIGKIYSPGAKITLCSDGRVFSDLVGIEEKNVTLYQDHLDQIVKKYGLSCLSTFNLDRVLPGATHDEMRLWLDKGFSATEEDLRQRVKTEFEQKQLFNGIHRFLFEDYLFLHPEKSRNQIRKLTKNLAYKVVLRSNAWGSFLEKWDSKAIRLSIHPQAPGSKKFPVQLVHCQDRWATPWHNVAFRDKSGEFRLMKLSEALGKGAKLELFAGELAYFEAA